MFYRLRNYLNYAHFRHCTRGIHNTPPTPCCPEAACELHTMLSRRDLPLYLVAAKSFLRFHADVAVVVHDDGSLDPACSIVLERHLPGCRIIHAAEADAKAAEALSSWPQLRHFRAIDASWRRLIDTDLWSRTEKRIIMDSDIITLRSPHQVIEWIASDERPFLMGKPSATPFVPTNQPAPTNAHVQTKFKAKVAELASALGVPPVFEDGTTSAFYGCRPEALPLERVERLLQAAAASGVPMHEWGGEQCTVVYLLSVAGANRLSSEHYLNYYPDVEDRLSTAVLVHFIGTNRFHKNHYPQLANRLVQELRENSCLVSS